ncbi:MAG: glycosyltransferase family 4 protein [Bacteroidales bacterium]|nr:glycosyltransferase family 4 protein [Bacteroidales bacterium]
MNFTNIKNESIFDKDYLRKNYHIKERNIILFVSRITPAKKVELLIEAFQSNSDVAVVIIGDGLNEIHYKQITGLLNFYYFNGVYDKEELGKFFYCSDIFCIPGNPGLALNEALFWGKPVITMKGRKTPEIYYLKNGYNGYIADSVEDMKRKAIGLLNDRARYLEMSENARKTYENEAHISRMFNGFKEAVDFVINKKNSKLKKR